MPFASHIAQKKYLRSTIADIGERVALSRMDCKSYVNEKLMNMRRRALISLEGLSASQLTSVGPSALPIMIRNYAKELSSCLGEEESPTAQSPQHAEKLVDLMSEVYFDALITFFLSFRHTYLRCNCMQVCELEGHNQRLMSIKHVCGVNAL